MSEASRTSCGQEVEDEIRGKGQLTLPLDHLARRPHEHALAFSFLFFCGRGRGARGETHERDCASPRRSATRLPVFSSQARGIAPPPRGGLALLAAPECAHATTVASRS